MQKTYNLTMSPRIPLCMLRRRSGIFLQKQSILALKRNTMFGILNSWLVPDNGTGLIKVI